MDLAEYRRASHAVWQAMAPGWDARNSYLEEAVRPVTERMLERLGPRPGETVLEVAAGTGLVGLAAAAVLGDAGRVVLTDFSEAMLDVARRRADAMGLANLEFRVLDAERMDLPDASMDAAICRYGYMLMADPAAALSETRRVLRPGGRMVCAVWATAERNPWTLIPARALVEAGHMPPPEPGAPGIHALADPDRLRGLIAGAGFADPLLEEVESVWPFSGADEYWDFLLHLAGPVSLLLARLGEADLAGLREAIDPRLEAFRSTEGYTLPGVSLVASATVPPA